MYNTYFPSGPLIFLGVHMQMVCDKCYMYMEQDMTVFKLLCELIYSIFSARYNICLWANRNRKNIYHGR